MQRVGRKALRDRIYRSFNRVRSGRHGNGEFTPRSLPEPELRARTRSIEGRRRSTPAVGTVPIKLFAAAAAALATAAPIALTAAQAAAPASRPAAAAAAPDVFGSRALGLGQTRYSDRWRRVASSGPTAQLIGLVKPARALPAQAKAEFVNLALNRRIRYQFDMHASGDYWATARETLSRGAGDCEDYVIAKMHALRALGLPAGDLFMTIGQDSAAGAAHAVLLVRAGGRFLVLDNRLDRLIAQEAYRDFYPIISFSAAGKSWLHGYPRGQTPAYVKTLSARFAQGLHTGIGSSEASRRPWRVTGSGQERLDASSHKRSTSASSL